MWYNKLNPNNKGGYYVKKYPGLYLYFDWLRGLENVPSETAMEIINNLWHYAEERRPSIPLSDPRYEIVQFLFMEQMKRSIHKSEVNARNVSKRFDHAQSVTKKSFSEMSDEELLELFRTDESYKDDDPEELLALHHASQKHTAESHHGNA